MSEWETIRDAGSEIFFEVLEQDPIVQNDDVMGSYECYWCASSHFSGLDMIHKENCSWKRVQDLFEKVR